MPKMESFIQKTSSENMETLIPLFIRQNHSQKRYNGKLWGATMFVDISGFTHLTQTLMRIGGAEGAEVLSTVLNTIFTPLINYIYDYGGFVSNFVGDAFTAIFSDSEAEECLRALTVAQEIQNFFLTNGQQKTKFGVFNLSVKIGISWGEITYGILGKPEIVGQNARKYYFHGASIERCTKAEKYAAKETIVFDEVILDKVSPLLIKHTKVADNYYQLQDLKSTKNALKKNTPDIVCEDMLDEVAKHFVPEEILNFADIGEFRIVVPVFISFRNTDTLDLLNDFISVVLKYLIDYHGDLNLVDFGDKGGVLVCFFGAPTTHENDQTLALNFILMLQKAYEIYPSLKQVEMRVGMTVGKVFSGIIGSEKRCHYTSLGGVVNLAARMMMKANWQQVLVSKEITATPGFNYKYSGDFAFKGFAKTISAFELLKDRIQFIQPIFNDVLIGREKAVQLIHYWMKPVFEDNRGGVGYIFGEPGIGKSRLAFEIEMEVNQQAQWFHCACDAIVCKAFNPFLVFLQYYFNQHAYHDDAMNLAEFEQKLVELIEYISLESTHPEKDRIITDLQESKEVLAILIGVLPPTDTWTKLAGESRYFNTMLAIKNLFLAESICQPIILHLENASWLDEHSLALLQFIMSQVGYYPIFVLCTTRYNDDGSLPSLPIIEDEVNTTQVHHLHLSHLTKEESKQLSINELGGSISKDLFELLFAKTKGNPFFIKHLINYFREHEYIKYENGYWNILLADLVIPTSLNSLLLAQLDRLPPSVKAVVKAAAIIGTSFEVEVLFKILGRNVTEELNIAANAQIWNLVQGKKGVFSYALLRDVAYDMQLREQQKKLHLHIAEVLEELYVRKTHKKQEDKYVEIAFHFEKANYLNKAIEYWVKAGKYEQKHFRLSTALSFYDKALAYLATVDSSAAQTIDILLHKSTILQNFSDWEASDELLIRVVQLSKAIRNTATLAEADLQLGENLINRNQYKAALTHIEQALQFFQKHNNTIGIAKAKSHLAHILCLQSDYLASLQLYQEVQELLVAEEEQKMLGAVVGNIANIYYWLGNFAAALAHYEEGLALADEFGQKQVTAIIMGDMMNMFFDKGAYEKALIHAQEMLRFAKSIGNQWLFLKALNNIANVYVVANQLDKALGIYQEALGIAKSLKAKRMRSIVRGNIGGVYWKQGKFQEALACYEYRHNIAKELLDKKGRINSLQNIAEIYFLTGKLDKAVEYIEKADKIGEQIANKQDKVMSTILLAQIAQQNREWKVAEILYEEVIITIRKIENLPLLTDVLLHQTEVFLQQEKIVAAQTCLAECFPIMLKIKHHKNIFLGKVLEAKINAVLKQRDKAVVALISLLKEVATEDEEQLARLHYELWQIFHNYNYTLAAYHKKTAATLYEKIYEKNPTILIKNYLEVIKKGAMTYSRQY